ncbi:MAG TPA: zinc-dependent metalloprotease [Jiangellales bacterium]|nr:zinc-dependent metalloprotease [Jiangellales bacterium]
MSSAAEEPGRPADMVDWDLAVATARRLAPAGPVVEAAEARAVVSDLRSFAAAAEDPVRTYTGLDGTSAPAPLVVVDRGGWSQANADGMRQLIDPLVVKLRAARPAASSPLVDGVGPKITGVETGALLAFLSSKVLGQFDPFWSDGNGAAGRLLLVAPNVVHVERELGVDTRDFRLWVCLHEETHRVQFTAVPWLRDHLRGQVGEFVAATDVDPTVLFSRLRAVVEAVVDTARGGGADGPSLIDLVQSPEQKVVLDRITALMSLLEGHADVVMDGVGPQVVPSVDEIRAKFQKRRQSSTGLDRTVRRLLGLEAKMRQYRDGAKFVRGVLGEVGMSGFNRVWESPDTLPTLAEIAEPSTWVRRVHGQRAVTA